MCACVTCACAHAVCVCCACACAHDWQVGAIGVDETRGASKSCTLVACIFRPGLYESNLSHVKFLGSTGPSSPDAENHDPCASACSHNKLLSEAAFIK